MPFEKGTPHKQYALAQKISQDEIDSMSWEEKASIQRSLTNNSAWRILYTGGDISSLETSRKLLSDKSSLVIGVVSSICSRVGVHTYQNFDPNGVIENKTTETQHQRNAREKAKKENNG